MNPDARADPSMDDRLRQQVRDAATAVWPVFGLRVRTPRVELRAVDPATALDLAQLAVRGIHDPDDTPFAVPWTDAPAAELPRNSFRHYSHAWATWTPDAWHLMFAVLVDGELVGQQDLIGRDFRVLRTVETGSWLTRPQQGRGIGTEMRAAALHLAFAGLGALVAHTAAWDDNAASLGVTRALGYRANGETVGRRRDRPARLLEFRLPREEWEARRRDDIAVDGLAAALAEFGLGPDRRALDPEPAAPHGG